MIKPTIFHKLEFLNIRPANFGIVIMLSSLAALTESFGLAILLPILEFLENGSDRAVLIEQNKLWEHIFFAFEAIGFQVSLYSLLGVAVGLLTIRSFVHYCRHIYNSWLLQHMSHSARFGIIRSHIQMQFREFERNSNAQLINILSNELPRATGSLFVWLQLFSNLFMFIGLFSLLLVLSPLLTAMTMALIFFTSLIILFVIRNTALTSLNASKANKAFAESFGEMFQLLKFVKLSSLENDVIHNIKQQSNEIKKQFFKLANYKALIDLYIEPIVILSGSIVLVIAIDFLHLSLSETGLFMLVLLRMLPISKTVHQSYQTFAAAAGSRKVLFDTYFWANSIAEENTGNIHLDKPTSISFVGVDFSYSDSQTVLKNVNLCFKSGEISALIGPAGAGKSTIVELMLRIYDPTSGNIYFNDGQIQSLDLNSIRRNISFVTQDSYFIDGSMRDNLLVAELEITEKQMLEKIQAVFGKNFIEEFPEKLDTQVGFCGSRLSGGQRQMLAMTRAILENNKIIVLDEPTSALDLQSQKRVNDIISSLRSENRIIVLISHIEDTISIADTINVLMDGKIVEAGSQENLLKSNGWFKTHFCNKVGQHK